MNLARKALGVFIILSFFTMIVTGGFLAFKLYNMLDKTDHHNYRNGIGPKPEDKPVWWD